MLSHNSIRNLIYDTLKLEITNIDENKLGCDQFIWIISTKSRYHGKLILKKPKHDVCQLIFREVLACQLFNDIGIKVPQILYWDEEFLIETFIEGIHLDECKFKNSTNLDIFYRLGSILKKIHSISASGFGMVKDANLKGVFESLISYLDSGFDLKLQNLKESGLFTIEEMKKIQEYYQQGKKTIICPDSVLLHSDFADSNILITSKKELSLIDFADLSIGHPMQDFAYMYEKYPDTPHFSALLDGYGSTDIYLIKYFTFCRLFWLIPLLHSQNNDKCRLSNCVSLFLSICS